MGNQPDDPRPTSRLGVLLLAERQRRGLTRAEMARLIRRADRTMTTTEDSVKQWENYGRVPVPATLRAIAAVLERPVEELVAAGRRGSATPPLLLGAAGLESLTGADDHAYAASIRETIQTLVGLEVRHGGNEAGPLAGRCLEAARRRLGQGGSGAEVVAAVAELAEVAGWLHHDADRQDAARRLHHEALHLAHMAGDRDMELFTLGLLAFVEIWDQRAGTALMIARSALAADLTSRQVAMFAIREGRALAMLGDRTGSLRAMDRAGSALQGGVLSDEPDWAWWLDESELLHHVGRCHAALGDHTAALEVLQRANELCPAGRISGRFNYLAHTLESAAGVGAWPDAEALVVELLPNAGVIGSGRTESVIRRSAAEILAAPAGATLQDAAQQLRQAIE